MNIKKFSFVLVMIMMAFSWLIPDEIKAQNQLQIRRSNELTRSAIQLLRAQKPEKAKFELQRAIRLNPKNILAHELLAIIFYRQQRIREAEKHATIAVSINQKASRALFVLGAINTKRGRSDLALEQLQTALVALPDAEYRAEARDLMDKIRSQSDDSHVNSQRSRSEDLDIAPLALDYKPAIAVFPFEDANARAEMTKLSQSVTEMLITALIQTGRFTVIERVQLDKIISEQALGQTGLIDTETAIEIGKLSGLSGIVVGSLTQLRSALEADARLIDVGSGKSLAAASSRVSNLDDTRQLAIDLAYQLAAKADVLVSPADTAQSLR